uniref:Uncharacterized protein n=1 Tax=Vespula pensylvanica TaxID=30213 RepID=A0A834U8T3_VESPE|nr:hypothetical protein H0235_009803 [Vespula pensylvanica]
MGNITVSYYNATTIRNWTPQTTIVAKLRKGHNQCQRCPRSCYVMHQIKDAIASVTPSMLDRVCSNIEHRMKVETNTYERIGTFGRMKMFPGLNEKSPKRSKCQL